MDGFQIMHLVLGLPILIIAIGAAAIFGVPYRKAENVVEWIAVSLLFGTAVFVTVYYYWMP